jgi:hypothetical protein
MVVASETAELWGSPFWIWAGAQAPTDAITWDTMGHFTGNVGSFRSAQYAYYNRLWKLAHHYHRFRKGGWDSFSVIQFH